MTDWSTEDKVLQSDHGPHEVSAVLRMHKHGWPGSAIVKALKVKATSVVSDLNQSSEDERRALTAGRPIHDVQIPKEDA